MRLWVRSPALLSGLRIRRCRGLWCRLQTQFRFRVAVALALAGGHSSNSTPSLGTSICCKNGPGNGKKTTTKKSGSSPAVQWVKDQALSLQQLGRLLWRRFSPWLGKFQMPQVWQTKQNKQTKVSRNITQILPFYLLLKILLSLLICHQKKICSSGAPDLFLYKFHCERLFITHFLFVLGKSLVHLW